jgi:rhodanese-related sulfurtransferase
VNTTASSTIPNITNPTSAVREVDPAAVADWLRRGECIVCDVREPDEHAAEHIDGTTLRPLSKLDFSGLKQASPRVVFHCKSGKRSADAAARALAALPGVEVCTMVGGIEAWKRANLPTIRTTRAVGMTVLQQTQLAIGLMTLTGLGIGFFVHPAGYALSALMGAGLTFAGITGFCGLMNLLAIMPWNRVPTTTNAAPVACQTAN